MNYEAETSSQEKEATYKSLDSIAQELITNRELKELPGAERGTVILDRFIGSVVRHGEVEGGKASYSPADVLQGMDNVSWAGPNGLMKITRTEGLRDAVSDLALDIDVAKLFGKISGRLSQDEEGKYTLTSPAQIEGYLLAGGDKNFIKNPVGGVDMRGDAWIPVIMEQAQRVVDEPHYTWMTNREAREHIDASGLLQKNTGRDVLMATSSAQKAGVDIELLRRSAENVKRRIEDGQDMASAAFFLATEGKVTNYRQQLHERSR